MRRAAVCPVIGLPEVSHLANHKVRRRRGGRDRLRVRGGWSGCPAFPKAREVFRQGFTCRDSGFRRISEAGMETSQVWKQDRLCAPLSRLWSFLPLRKIAVASYEPFYCPKYDAHDETQEAKELFRLLAVSSGSAFCRQLGGEVILLGWRAARFLGASRPPCDSRTLLLSIF